MFCIYNIGRRLGIFEHFERSVVSRNPDDKITTFNMIKTKKKKVLKNGEMSKAR